MGNSLERKSQPVVMGRTVPLGLASLLLVLLPIIWPALAMFRFARDFPAWGYADSLLYAVAAAPALAIITLAVPVFGILVGGMDLYQKTRKFPGSAALALASILGMVTVFLFPSSGSIETQYGLIVAVILWLTVAVLVVRQLASARQDRTTLALIAIGLGPLSFAVTGALLVLLSFAVSWGMTLP